jgi:tetratricopeptide (TPR) repeat protein
MEDDLKALPDDSFKLWRDHLNFLESEGRLSTSEKNVLRSIALAMKAVLAIDFEVLEKFYVRIFRGDLSEFDYALDEVVKKFFIGIEGELCSMHAVQAEVVEEKYPAEEHKIALLKEVLTALERYKSLILLSAFAGWFCANKKYLDCLKFMDVFIEKEPNKVEGYNNRGIAYMGLKEHERAIEDYNKAIELNPNYAGAYCNRGIAYAGLKQHERAIEDYNKAIKLNPNRAWAYYNRGISYAELKQHERAKNDFNKAIELNPNLAWAYFNRGTAYVKLKQYERAINDYNKTIELNWDDAEAYFNRGIAYRELKQHVQAIKDYNKAIELNRDDAKAYYNRGTAYLKLKQYERAIKDYNSAIELNLNFAEAYVNRGVAYSEIGRYEESARDFKKAGILFFNSGMVDQSVKTFSFCFDLRAKIENEDVIYSGLALFLMTKDANIKARLKRMRIEDETLRKIYELTLKKLQNEDILEEIAAFEREDGRKEMKILLELLRNL